MAIDINRCHARATACAMPSSAHRRTSLTRRRGRGTWRSCGIRSTRRGLWSGLGRIFARSKEPWITGPGPMPPVHSAMAAVSCSEYRPQDDQPCQREGPEAEVPSKLLESAFRTVGQIKNEIATDSQRCRRNQRYEVNHFRPPPQLRSARSAAELRMAAEWILRGAGQDCRQSDCLCQTDPAYPFTGARRIDHRLNSDPNPSVVNGRYRATQSGIGLH
jgi:hypothetical protein